MDSVHKMNTRSGKPRIDHDVMIVYRNGGRRVRLRVFPGSFLGSPGGSFLTQRFETKLEAEDCKRDIENDIVNIKTGKTENKILSHFSLLKFDQPILVTFADGPVED
jgi:hypothetical protein